MPGPIYLDTESYMRNVATVAALLPPDPHGTGFEPDLEGAKVHLGETFDIWPRSILADTE